MEAEKLAYDVSDLVMATRIGRTTIYSEIKSGRLKPTKIGHRTIFRRAAVEAWLDGRGETGAAA